MNGTPGVLHSAESTHFTKADRRFIHACKLPLSLIDLFEAGLDLNQGLDSGNALTDSVNFI